MALRLLMLDPPRTTGAAMPGHVLQRLVNHSALPARMDVEQVFARHGLPAAGPTEGGEGMHRPTPAPFAEGRFARLVGVGWWMYEAGDETRTRDQLLGRQLVRLCDFSHKLPCFPPFPAGLLVLTAPG